MKALKRSLNTAQGIIHLLPSVPQQLSVTHQVFYTQNLFPDILPQLVLSTRASLTNPF